MKKCKACGLLLDEGEFTIAHGTWLKSYCKKCCGKKSTEYGRNNRDKMREYFAKFAKKNPDKLRELNRRSYYKNVEKYKAASRAYYHANKENMLAAHKKWACNNAERLRLYRRKYAQRLARKKLQRKRATLANARRLGKIRKRNICEICYNSPSECHHPDYDKPLEFIELCKRCHEHLHHRKYSIDKDI